MKECPKCNSDEIVPSAMVLDSGQSSSGTLQLAIDEDPTAAFFKNRVRSYVRATVCGSCGYVEFYAGLPQELYRAYQNMLKNMEG